jgi:hypothetical protein
MSDPNSVFGLSGGAWSALSAIGTIIAAFVAAAAAIIALRVPIRIAKDDRREAMRIAERQRQEQIDREGRIENEAKADKARRLHEVASAVYNALDCLNDALATWAGDGAMPVDLLPAAGRASGHAEALRILAHLPGLSDGPIMAATSAAQAMDRICEAARFVANQGRRSPSGALMEGLEAGRDARARILDVVNYHKIPVRGGGDAPVLPDAVN